MDDGCLGAQRCLEEIRPDHDRAVAAGRAVGLGLGLKNSGLGNGFKEHIRAVVRFAEDGTVEVRHCWTEMGQGVHTVALQVAVTELGIDAERIRVITDTTRELGAGQTTGSRGTLMGAGAVADACRRAIADGCRPGVDYEGEYRVDWTHHLGEVEQPIIHSAFGYAAQLVVMDPETQMIEEVVAVHDVGRAVNPLLCEGQVEGSVHMGLGYALTEEFPADPETGHPTNMTLRSLGILRAKDVPPIRVRLVECPQPRAPYGIKGVGEIGLVPTAPAVAAALHAADGIWRSQLPMKPKRSAARRGLAVGGRHARPGLRPPPPVLRPRSGHAATADPPDELPRDPPAGLVAAGRRARPRDPAVVGPPRRHRGADGWDDRDHRPPRVARRDRGLAVGDRRGVRRGRRPGRDGLRRHRPLGRPGPAAGGRLAAAQDDRRGPPRPGRERALPPRRRAGDGRGPRRVHVQRRHAGRRRRSRGRPRRGCPRPRRRGHRRPRRRRPAWPAWPTTTGCSCTASTSTGTCPGPSPTTLGPT